MKYLILIAVLALSLLTACAVPPEDVAKAEVVMDDSENKEVDLSEADTIPINPNNSNFEFEGYAVGKSHVGTFDVWSGSISYIDGEIAGFEGKIDTASVNTGLGGLDKHLKSEDFFEVETYPTIEFKSTMITGGVASGMLNFHGVEQEVSFPINETENSVSTEFLLNTVPFGIDYTGVNSDVRIAFSFSK